MKAFIIFVYVPVFFILVSCGPRTSPAAGYFHPSEWKGSATVLTKYGMIEGRKDASNTFVWKGIPFARPPVGELRWKAPREVQPWNGTLIADRFRGYAPQYFPVLLKVVTGSEDCLYLNVWRPGTLKKNLPVYIFIHGGGNSTGSSDFENYYGFTLAHVMNAVYVSIDYRLGPLGWLTHPALREGAAPEDASGNYGTLDILQALRWVRGNIATFGGASNRVVIAGESAGAINILSLLISPLAGGLFDGAVIESGIDVVNSIQAGDRFSGDLVEKLLVRDGKAKDMADAKKIAVKMGNTVIKNYLYSKSPEELFRVQKPGAFGMLSAPYIFSDGTVIPKDGFESLRNGTISVHVPILIGCNRDENKLFLAMDKSVAWNSGAYQSKARYMSLNWKVRGVDSVAHFLAGAKGQPPFFVYRFDWGTLNDRGESVLPGNMGKRFGSCHSLEIPFFMGSGKPAISILTGDFFTVKNREGREKLSRLMMEYLSSFIHTGNPNSAGLRTWPSWSNQPGVNKAIVFDADYREPVLTYLDEELTLSGIVQQARAELKGSELAQVMENVTNWMANK